MVEKDFQKLEDMSGYWKDKKQQHYEALVQEWELLGHIGDGIVKVWKYLDNIHGRYVELDELDEKIQHGDPKLQELMNERVHLRERSTMLQAKVKGLEDEIKK